MVRGVRALGMEACCTLGMLTDEQARRARRRPASTAYNHNLDTSPDYYGEIITTRTYDDRLDTLEARAQGRHHASAAAASSAWARSIDDRCGMLRHAGQPARPPGERARSTCWCRRGHAACASGRRSSRIELVRMIATARILMPQVAGAPLGRARAHERGGAGAVLPRRRQLDLLRRRSCSPRPIPIATGTRAFSTSSA